MPPPVKDFLTSEQVSKLQKALRESEQPHVRERIFIILLQNDGKTQQETAKFLGCSPRTVTSISKRIRILVSTVSSRQIEGLLSDRLVWRFKKFSTLNQF